MKKRGKKINFHLSNKLSYTLVAIVIVLIIGVGVYALTPGVAPNPGHSISEVAPPSPCTANQNLQWSGTDWVCTTITPSNISKGTQIFTTSSYCGLGGTLTTARTCSSAVCGTTLYYCCVSGVCGNYCYYSSYYTCSGSCSAGGSQSCSNTPVGYVVN